VAKPGSLPVGRYFLGLAAILVVLYAIVFWPGARHTPKLGLDLVGGTQVIFTAHVEGGGTPSSSSMSQAKQIITDRVNGNGVTEATVVIQGSNQIVVSIPGDTNVDPSSLGATAKLNFRGLVAAPVPVTCTGTSQLGGTQFDLPASGTVSPTTVASAFSSAGTPPTSTPKAVTSSGSSQIVVRVADTSTSELTAAKQKTLVAAVAKKLGVAASKIDTKPLCATKPFAALEKSGVKIPTSEAAFQKLSSTQQSAISAALANFDCSSAQGETDNPDSYYVACDGGSNYGTPLAFLLGTVIVPGTQISSASAVAPNTAQGITGWQVSLDMKAKGQKAWAKYTSAHNVGSTSASPDLSKCGASGTPCADFVGFTLDGQVISNPYNETAINGGQTAISGHFTSETAKALAQQLKYGALPLNFTPDTAQTVSATLGSSQLKAGMLAGGIGLILVVLYSLLYYRALGLVTIASLLVSGALVYGSIVMLGTQMGFTLSLAGIAGFIVAVGITTDSFVVFFERIKDEVHEGRSVRVAIPRAWIRARRTILSADTVSILAAAILYYFAAGDVKGFAFTLGLSTILDMVVVFLFTHPLLSLLSRMKAFGTGRFTGLAHIRDSGSPVAEAPGRVTRPAQTARRGAAGDAAEAMSAVSVTKSSVATLEADERAAADERATADEPVVTPVAEGDAEAGTGPDADGPSERRHTTPEPGSAAERAAARRARLREKGGR
jgi:preprotein translocase subunit SecD